MGCLGCKTCRLAFPRVVVDVGMFGVPGRDDGPPSFRMVGVDGREDKMSSGENFHIRLVNHTSVRNQFQKTPLAAMAYSHWQP